MTRATQSTQLQIEYLQGIHVVDSVLWLDAPRPADLCFVSHAHLDRGVAHRKILATRATAALLGRRRRKAASLLCPFGRRFALGDLDIVLHPAGHLPGSAQILVRRDRDRLAYTGDFSLDRSRTAEPATILEADTLVLECHYGLPHQVFPPRPEVEAALLAWVGQMLQSGRTPVLFASILGKAQELARLLGDAGHRIQVHRSIHDICRAYDAIGVKIPGIRRFNGRAETDAVVLLPPGLRGSATIPRLRDPATAMATGAAVEPDAPLRLGVETVFPLSGHADHAGLRRYVKDSGADRIFLVGRSAAAFAAQLRDLGMDAWPLQPAQQLDLFHPGRLGAAS